MTMVHGIYDTFRLRILCCVCWCRYSGRNGLVPASKLKPKDPNNPANVRWPACMLQSHMFQWSCIHTIVWQWLCHAISISDGTMQSVKAVPLCKLDVVGWPAPMCSHVGPADTLALHCIYAFQSAKFKPATPLFDWSICFEVHRVGLRQNSCCTSQLPASLWLLPKFVVTCAFTVPRFSVSTLYMHALVSWIEWSSTYINCALVAHFYCYCMCKVLGHVVSICGFPFMHPSPEQVQ